MTDEELVIKAKSGDNDALLELWQQKRGLVYTFARKRYSMLVDFGNTRGADMDDLMQCGFLALLRAVNSYDPKKPFAFSTCLGNAIKTEFNYLLRMRDHSKIDVLDSAASLDDVIKGGRTKEAYDDDPLSVKIPDPVDCYAAVEDRIMQEQQHEAIDKVLARIPDNQQTVVRLRYYEELTLEESAVKMGKTYNQLRVLLKNAMKYLRSPEVCAELSDYIDLHTNFYLTGSVERQESPVEILAERRERMRNRWRGDRKALSIND